MADERVLDRIGKLLAQAEGTDNEHEADAFVTRAQELATSYAVDLEQARARQAARRGRAGGADSFEQRTVTVGERAKRGNRQLVLLYVIVARANEVMVNVAHDSTFVVGFGYPDDLDVVEQLWASLATQMAGAAGRRLRAGEHRTTGVPAVSWRLSFYDGWLVAVQERLTTARARALRAVDAVPADRGSDQRPGELVLRAKAERVREFHDQASQARGSWRGARAGHQSSNQAFSAGHRDGQLARLGEPAVEQRRALG